MIMSYFIYIMGSMHVAGNMFMSIELQNIGQSEDKKPKTLSWTTAQYGPGADVSYHAQL